MLNSNICSRERGSKTLKLYSFDIFDTLITRRVASPLGIFKLIQYKIQRDNSYPSTFSNNFILIRTEAEVWYRNYVYKKSKQEDVTLDEIYNVIQENYNLSKEIIDKLKKLEIETEIKNIIPIKNNIKLLKTKMSIPNAKVILVSDMYLPKIVIREMLRSVDSCFENIPLYLSCEEGGSKHYGSLYKIVKNTENIDIRNWIHYGDNEHADKKRAFEHGIHSKMVKKLEITNFNKYLIKNCPEELFPEICAGISRYLNSSKKMTPYTLGTNITAPLLYGFVDWVIQQSCLNNEKDLYFVSRDGFLLKIIADEIITRKKYNINTHYIYGSRIAWRLIDKNNYKLVINNIFQNYKKMLTLESIAKQLHINANDIITFFGKINNLLELEKNMLNSSDFKEFVVLKNKERIDLLRKYINQECSFAKNNISFVDLDGSGFTQDCLYSILKPGYKGIITTYYFLQYYITSNNSNSQKKCYFKTFSYFTNWIERLTRSLEGQTLGYTVKDKKIVPVLDDYRVEGLNAKDFHDYIKAIKDFTNEIIDFEEINNLKFDSYKFFIYLDKYYNEAKDNTDLTQILSQVQFEDIHKNANLTGFTFGDCFKMFIGSYVEDSFTHLDYLNSNLFAKLSYKFHKKYGSFRKFIINIYVGYSSNRFNICILGIKISCSKIIILFKRAIGGMK